MITSTVKDKIKMYMNVQEFLCDKRVPTDADWDKYFIESYSNNVAIEIYKEDFITYEVMHNCIFIKDIVCEKASGIHLMNKVIKVAQDAKKPIMAFIHYTNTRLLDIVQRRYGFVLGQLVGKQYIVIREAV
jgi:hypothetical protein